jgi:hypothetical protein
MNTHPNIEGRLSALRQRLAIIEAALEGEMRKPWQRRRRNLLYFLYCERKMYSFAITELESLENRILQFEP